MDISFINSVTINDKPILYKELLVKHLKVIYKTLIGDNPEPKIVVRNFNSIITSLTNLTEEDLNQISFVDYFLLLFELRCTSIGDTIFAELTDKENTTIELNINRFIDIIKKINYNDLLANEFIEDFEIIYKIPSILECLEINEKENFDIIYRYFIKKIIYKNFTIEFTTLNTKTSLKILEQLPAKITAAIVKRAYEITEQFSLINLLSTTPALQDKFLAFNFNMKNIILLIKLLFGDQLMSLYDNIFILCRRSNFTPEYIENCTPGEYFLYIKKLEALVPKQRSNDVDITAQNSANMDPFGDLPPITSRSEFTP